jgi:hypothetical protein
MKITIDCPEFVWSREVTDDFAEAFFQYVRDIEPSVPTSPVPWGRELATFLVGASLRAMNRKAK